MMTPSVAVSILAAGLALSCASTAATAQWRGEPDDGRDAYGQGDDDNDRYGSPARDPGGDFSGAQYDVARVIRVDPVIVSSSDDARYGDQRGYGRHGRADGYGNEPVAQRRCRTRQDDGYVDGYGDPGNPGYADGNDGYGNDGGDVRDSRVGSTDSGRSLATVAGSVVGALLGSRVGGGSARYATAAIGTVLGGVAGRQIYDGSHPAYDPRAGRVTVCDPEPVRGDAYGDDAQVVGYDVTYDYAGRRYVTRTDYHPGDTIRVRVDVRPE